MSFSAFVIATLALNLAPGPDMTYVAARALAQGRRAGIISALGIGVGSAIRRALAGARRARDVAARAVFDASGTLVNIGVAIAAARAGGVLQSSRGWAWLQRASGSVLLGLDVAKTAEPEAAQSSV
jgi:threonine/homoserine/homoserine lactone efflux protein